MTFTLIFVITASAAVALADVVRKWPWLFYGLSILAVLVLFAGTQGVISDGWWKPLILLVRRCMVALSLFTVVMFTGVFSKESKLGSRLRSVRSELSIIACILCLGHVCMYLVPYLSRAASGSLGLQAGTSFYIAMVLLILLMLLGITSFDAVKKRMKGASWKHIQRLAYPFFLLTYAHLMFMLAPAAFRGGEQAIIGVILYSIIFTAYVVLRMYRFAKDKRVGQSRQVNDGASNLKAREEH